MKAINECIEENGKKKAFARTEKKKTFTLQSNIEFECKIIGIDDCVFKGENTKRCDYLFVVPKNNVVNKHLASQVAYFVELKGNDFDFACEQLYNAIWRTKGELLNHKLEARVVSTKGIQPGIKNSGFYRKVRKLIRNQIIFCKVHNANNFNHKETLI